MGNDKIDYKAIASQSRLKVLDMIYAAQTSHIGSNFSVADIMAVLMSNVDLDKDKVIMSAGWKAAMFYFHLWRLNRLSFTDLTSYCQPGSKYIGLVEPIHKDIPFAGGSMGMGLAAGVALAWSKKQRNEEGKIYVIESDGGMQEGSTWEAMWFAAQHNLDNLVLIIDNNGFQAMGETRNILNNDRLKEKIDAFGWAYGICNGHDYRFIESWLKQRFSTTPMAIIANTIKGKGVSFMENNNIWHYKSPNKEEYEKAKIELLQ